jgi:hypothetical protein
LQPFISANHLGDPDRCVRGRAAGRCRVIDEDGQAHADLDGTRAMSGVVNASRPVEFQSRYLARWASAAHLASQFCLSKLLALAVVAEGASVRSRTRTPPTPARPQGRSIISARRQLV